MAHLDPNDLYALLYQLREHQHGSDPIAGVTLDEELARVVQRLSRRDYSEPPAAEHRLSSSVVQSVLKHTSKCPSCQQVLCEDGPSARRRQTETELRAAEEQQEAEERRLTRRFFIALVYAILALGGSVLVQVEYNKLKYQPRVTTDGAILESTEPAQRWHPLQIATFGLIVIAAWGFADAFMIANQLWLDWSRAKAAVPFIGQKWAARSQRKKQSRK